MRSRHMRFQVASELNRYSMSETLGTPTPFVAALMVKRWGGGMWSAGYSVTGALVCLVERSLEP